MRSGCRTVSIWLTRSLGKGRFSKVTAKSQPLLCWNGLGLSKPPLFRKRNRVVAISEQIQAGIAAASRGNRAGMATAKALGMSKLNLFFVLTFAAGALLFSSCASQPAMTSTTTTTSTSSNSPMNRNNANGLASYMH